MILLSAILISPMVAFLLLGEEFLRVSTDRKDQPVDAIVVMAGSPSEDRRRIEAAISLFHQRKARYLILPMRHPTFTWSWAVNTYHLQPSVPIQRILIGRSGDSDEVDLATVGGTFVEARKAANLLISYELVSAVVVSSAYHMRRSRMAFDQMRKIPPLQFFYHPAEHSDPMWWTRQKKFRQILREYKKLIAALVLYPSQQ